MTTNKPTKEDLDKFQEDATVVAAAMAKAMFGTSQDKRVCMVAAVRVAAGCAAMGGMDLHRAIHMFMSFYKDADQKFEGVEQ
jgi:hypothetical protein